MTFKNSGNEAHEIAFLRLNDGVNITAKELVALPEEEGRAKATSVGGGFALPGDTGYTVVDLQPGRYVVACFVPVGTTREVIESGKEPEGPPHAAQGMTIEFEVK